MAHEPRRILPKGPIKQHKGRYACHDHANRPARKFDHGDQPQSAQPNVGGGQEIQPGFDLCRCAKVLKDRDPQ